MIKIILKNSQLAHRTRSTMLRTALALAEKGMRIFPCKPRDKVPATPNGCKDATAGAELIRQWWEYEPQYNIGLATGAPSNVFAIDMDGLEAEAELAKLESAHGALPPTVAVITGRGRHLYFQMPPDVSVRNSASQVAPGVDVRGSGGYVLAPPSVHPSGKVYTWSVDSAKAIAAAPAWLLEKVTTPANGTLAATPASEWRALLENGVGEGARDCTVTRLAGHLLRRFVDPVVVAKLLHSFNETHCIPPLPPADIDRAVNSIAGRELARRNGRDRT
jgi:hypothetical protein